MMIRNQLVSIFVSLTILHPFLGILYTEGCMTTLRSPRVTNWGDWGNLQSCPDKTYVVGFRLKTERTQGVGNDWDDTALNGISFICGLPGQNYGYLRFLAPHIESSVGKWGAWGATYFCTGGSFGIGFQLRSESNQGAGDDTAASNFALHCGGGTDVARVDGDGMDWGDWTQSQFCPEGEAICGIKTQVETPQGAGDDTSLNNVIATCCPITSKAKCNEITNRLTPLRRRKRGINHEMGTPPYPKSNRTKRASHSYMRSTRCEHIEWSDERSLSNIGGGGPITYVGYKTVARADSTGTINVVTRVIAEGPWPVPCTRTSFGSSRWEKVMKGLGARRSDERGHIIASQICGPAAWYNLAPQTPSVNRNVGQSDGFGWFDAENVVGRWVKGGCGTAKVTVFINYAGRSSTRPKGFKYCYELSSRDQARIGSHYFDNE